VALHSNTRAATSVERNSRQVCRFHARGEERRRHGPARVVSASQAFLPSRSTGHRRLLWQQASFSRRSRAFSQFTTSMCRAIQLTRFTGSGATTHDYSHLTPPPVPGSFRSTQVNRRHTDVSGQARKRVNFVREEIDGRRRFPVGFQELQPARSLLGSGDPTRHRRRRARYTPLSLTRPRRREVEFWASLTLLESCKSALALHLPGKPARQRSGKAALLVATRKVRRRFPLSCMSVL